MTNAQDSRVLFFAGEHTANTYNRFPQLLGSCGLRGVELHADASPEELRRAVGRFPLLVPVFCVAPGRHDYRALVLGESFIHPKQALYVFGPDHRTLVPEPDLGLKLTIPTTLARRPLFADQACAMVLWDRRLCRGSYA